MNRWVRFAQSSEEINQCSVSLEKSIDYFFIFKNIHLFIFRENGGEGEKREEKH